MTRDEKFMARCIKLAENSVKRGESPFGSLITVNNKIIAESGNMVFKTNDMTQHAEMRVMLAAQKKLKSFNLSKCTIYTNCEPCSMCSFMIRELKIKRVVYALKSPYMGGHSKWNILEDRELEKFHPVFNRPPDVLTGVLAKEAMITFKKAGWGLMFKKSKKKTRKSKKQQS